MEYWVQQEKWSIDFHITLSTKTNFLLTQPSLSNAIPAKSLISNDLTNGYH